MHRQAERSREGGRGGGSGGGGGGGGVPPVHWPGGQTLQLGWRSHQSARGVVNGQITLLVPYYLKATLFQFRQILH